MPLSEEERKRNLLFRRRLQEHAQPYELKYVFISDPPRPNLKPKDYKVSTPIISPWYNGPGGATTSPVSGPVNQSVAINNQVQQDIIQQALNTNKKRQLSKAEIRMLTKRRLITNRRRRLLLESSNGAVHGTALDQYSLSQGWSVGGANDLTALVAPFGAFDNLAGFAWSENGDYFMCSNPSDGKLYSYSLSTPWDLSTVTNTGFNSIPGANCAGWSASDGLFYWGTNSSSDTLDLYPASAIYDLAEADVRDSQLTDTGMGSGSSTDGGWFLMENGTAAYALTRHLDGSWHLGRRALSTPFDLTSAGTLAEVAIGTELGTPNDKTQFWVDPTETYIYAMSSTEVIHLGTFGTAGDVSTLTWSATLLDVSPNTGTLRQLQVTENGNALWIASSGISSIYFYKYVL
jgi:hypothetical protein